MTVAAAADAPAAQCCCSITKIMTRYNYIVREAHTRISFASPPFGLCTYTHHGWSHCIVAVFLTPLKLSPKGKLVLLLLEK